MKKIISTIFCFVIMIRLISIVTVPKVFAEEVKYVVKPQFDSVGEFHEGLAYVNIGCDRAGEGGKWGFIDKTGKIIINIQFDSVDNFSEGLAQVCVSAKWGFIDKSGKMIIKPQFDRIYDFSEGLAMVDVGGKYGFIDKTGKIAIKPQFNVVYAFHEGLAILKVGDKYGFIDKTGQIIIKPQFDAAGDFSEGLAGVNIGNKYGFIDKTGEVIIKPQFDSYDIFNFYEGVFHEGLASVRIDGKYGVIDKYGKVVIKPQFNSQISFYEGLANVSIGGNKGIGGKYGVIDKTGKIIIEPQFEHKIFFSEGLAMFNVGDKWGFIDRAGKIIIKPQFQYVGDFSEGLASAYIEGKWGFINKTGEMVIKPQFNHIISSSEELISVSIGGSEDGEGDKWGFIANPFAKISTPKVAIVSLDHVPFVEGDNNEFYISAKDYTGQVQYQLFYIQESVMKEWKLINNVDMVNGWTKAIDAQTPIIVNISSLNMKADKYRFAIRVRRVGVQGLKQNSYGDYDDAYPFNLDVAKNTNIDLSKNINMEKTTFSKNESLVINGVGNLPKDVQYKLHLFDVKNSKWLTDLTLYNTSINYSLKSIPEGTYIVDLWAKNSNSKNKYDGWKLKVITII